MSENDPGQTSPAEPEQRDGPVEPAAADLAEPTGPPEPEPTSPQEPELAGPPEPEGTGLPEPEVAETTEPAEEPDRPAPRRFTLTSAVVAVLLGLLGFTIPIQVRSVAEDPAAAALGQEDLVRILANLDAHEERLRQEIAELQDTHRRLTTAGESRQEALAEATRRADELGILAGTLPVTGPGLTVQLFGRPDAVSAAILLDAVQELRSAGAEAMQVEGDDGQPVRVVASTYFLDADESDGGGIVVDGVRLQAPYLLTVIGEPATLKPALYIPSGVVESVHRGGGTVTVQEEPDGVEVSAVREPVAPQYARPGS